MRAVDYLMPGGHLSRVIPGFEHRPSQLAMAEAVQRTLEDDGVLIVEAGTGTGKTLAYLVPALLSGRKVVISTGTKTLQDQIMESDLPVLEEHLGVTVHAAAMKGLGNYLCLRRFEELRRSALGAEGPTARQLPMIEEFRERTQVGDRAELETLDEDAAIWPLVSSSSETRIGAKCQYFDDCFITAMRRRAQEAQLVVVNHHLFFADLATRGPHGGGVLPDYDAVIFDEAHQIEDVVTQFFGVTVSSTRLAVLGRDARAAFGAARVGPEGAGPLRELEQASALFFERLPREGGAGRAALPREAWQGDLEDAMLRLDAALEAVELYARRQASEGEGVAQMARRAGTIRDDIAVIVEGGQSNVTWTEVRGRRASVGASPVDVSRLLRDELFYKTGAVVMTSATLSAGRSFSFIKQRLGIDFEVTEEILDSPFDYTAQAALYLPKHLPDPRDRDFVAAATDEVLGLVHLTGGGAFVLCTSIRNMEELGRRSRTLLDQTVMVQGEAPKATLLERFRADGHAVLFATASFWEGVDVPGDALRLVVIDKLPFDVPTDPLVAARCARMEERGEAPFMKYLVPSAALTLKQGFGRLIRSTTDRGIVAILDKRVVTKGYGHVFLKSLPPAVRCETLADVEAWWARQSSQRAQAT
ncbi:MAG: ATP-dependent DNA helicase [Deltaproteobacteria bacterium]|nr:MAG: ATP-dependent DNA helicase [Deltaproteobacteria bacterium]